jgi:hypothetical protein
MCGPLFLTVAGIGLLSVGTCLGFLTAALFATGAEPPKLAKPKMAVSIPDDAAELVWQAAESLYTLGSRLREGENPFVPPAPLPKSRLIFPIFTADSVSLHVSPEKDGKSGLVYARIGRCQGRPAWRGACAAVPRRYV